MGLVKNKPWDEVIQFDDWKEEIKDSNDDNTLEEESESAVIPAVVNGTEVSSLQDDKGEDIFNLISSLNTDNASYVETKKMVEQKSEDEILAEKLRKEEEERARINREQFERERAELEKRAFEEAERKAQEAAELQAKKEKSFFNKASKLLKPKKASKGKDAQNIEEETETSEVEPLVPDNSEEIEEAKNVEAIEKLEEEIENIDDSISLTAPNANIITSGKKEYVSRKSKTKHHPGKKETSKEDSDEQELESEISNTEELDVKSVTESMAETIDVSDEHKNTSDKTKNSGKTVKETKNKGDFFGFLSKGPAKSSEKEVKSKKEKSESKVSETKDEEIVEEKKVMSKTDWEFLATHDELTKLLNQRAYEEFKKNPIKDTYAVVMIDINNLKYTNDTFGHASGNSLITAVADQIKELFPDCGYRIGGDEFVIVKQYKSDKKAETEIIKKKESFHSALATLTKKEKDSGLVYAASFGYAISNGTEEFGAVADKADKAMYTEKKAYKEAHPQFNMRDKPAKKELPNHQKGTQPQNYDEMLSKDQQELKKYIQDNHVQVSTKSTNEIVREIQRRSSELVAILIASPTFDQLFIIQEAQTFIDVVSEMDSLIDYSYLYIVYQDGSQYKGSDEYLLQVKQVFEAISKGLITKTIQSESEVLKVKGINVFKNIFVDA